MLPLLVGGGQSSLWEGAYHMFLSVQLSDPSSRNHHWHWLPSQLFLYMYMEFNTIIGTDSPACYLLYMDLQLVTVATKSAFHLLHLVRRLNPFFTLGFDNHHQYLFNLKNGITENWWDSSYDWNFNIECFFLFWKKRAGKKGEEHCFVCQKYMHLFTGSGRRR